MTPPLMDLYQVQGRMSCNTVQEGFQKNWGNSKEDKGKDRHSTEYSFDVKLNNTETGRRRENETFNIYGSIQSIICKAYHTNFQ